MTDKARERELRADSSSGDGDGVEHRHALVEHERDVGAAGVGQRDVEGGGGVAELACSYGIVVGAESADEEAAGGVGTGAVVAGADGDVGAGNGASGGVADDAHDDAALRAG